MEIIEERTVGPSLGKENIEKGFNATLWGFIAIVVFMSLYYALFGVISSVALGVNLLFLVALLSLLQATLTLPGIAAIALTLGMAIDANVLINERIREELRGGATPQAAIRPATSAPGPRSSTRTSPRSSSASSLLIFGRARCAASRWCTASASSPRSSPRWWCRARSSTWSTATGARSRSLSIGNTAWK